MDRNFFLDIDRLLEIPNWQKSDQNSQFEPSLSSIVSSPVSPVSVSPVSPVSGSPVSNEIASIRQLIGKLGGGFSPNTITHSPQPLYNSNNSPLVSLPPKLVNQNFPCFPTDPGFAERAARYSCFGSRSFNGRMDQLGLNSNKLEVPIGSNGSPVKFPRVSSSPGLKIDRESRDSDEIEKKLSRLSGSAANSNTESSVSEQIPSGENEIDNRKQGNSRKRKGGSNSSNVKKEGEENDELKRVKKTEEENGNKVEDKKKAAEPPKDYIHVRARRGQATDSHSLAERVRREKISERMKLLQNLVPNCNKVTGKALMLDEIINYVQSLQRQVEFLSMKLATLNPSPDFDTNNLTSQNVNQLNEDLSHQTSTFYQQNSQVIFEGSAPMTQPVHEFMETFPHIEEFGQDDLQSIVRMGFGENLDLDSSFFQRDFDQPSNMKIEL